MAFVNEYIPEADYEKYDLRRVCGEHNLPSRRGHMHSRDWTIDRERGAFLIQVWSHHESLFSGWGFYLKGDWIFFEMRIARGEADKPDGSCWFDYEVKDFLLPGHLRMNRKEIVSVFEKALSDYRGAGVFSTCTHGTATVEFIGG